MTNEPQNPQDPSTSESVTSSITTSSDEQNPAKGQTITRDTEVKDGKVVKDETHKS